MGIPDWLSELRRLVDEGLAVDWESHLRRLNERLGLTDRDAFSITIPGLSPMWFNGDVEALIPERWVLVLSLNHQIGEYKNPPEREELWDFFRTHNRRYWYARFFRPLVRLASTALGEEVTTDEEPEFATTRMVFAELCPYASSRFALSFDTVKALSTDDPGFKTSAQINSLLMDEARPGVVLINGSAGLNGFKSVYAEALESWETLTYPSVDTGRPTKNLWHEQGWLRTPHGKLPAIGFPFLRTSRSHNSNAEIRQLGALARGFVTGANGG